MNRKTKLTDTLVWRLKPGNREYTVLTRSFPVSVFGCTRPAAAVTSSFVKEMKVSLGPVILKTLRDARSECPCVHGRRFLWWKDGSIVQRLRFRRMARFLGLPMQAFHGPEARPVS